MTSTNHGVNRASRDFASRIFACTDSGCTGWYGDGTSTCTTASNSDAATTDDECYVMKGVSGATDTDRVLTRAAYPNVTAVAALIYPSEWTNAGRLGLWWGWVETTGSTTTKKMTWRRTATSGWQNYNSTSWSADVLVAQQTTSGDFQGLSHPWVAAELVSGTVPRVRMFFPDVVGSAPPIGDIAWMPVHRGGRVQLRADLRVLVHGLRVGRPV